MRRIEDYALLSDSRSAALVSSAGSIDWLCWPRFDSAACFAALLGTEDNGHWSLRPAGESRVERTYLAGSLVLETVHSTPEGVVAVVDALVPDGDVHRLVRRVEGRSGAVPMRSEMRVRFDYGSIVPWVTRSDGALLAVAGPEALVMRAPVATHGEGFATIGEFSVVAGDSVSFDLAWYESHLAIPPAVDVDEALARTQAWWRGWSSQLSYEGAYRDDVHQSLTVLRGLSHAPTGSFVAAATTSLPEWIGGSRNWDYRYCWLRDATLTLLALVKGGFIDDARSWRDWLLRAVAGEPGRLQIMYGLAGERRLPEAELDWLDGFCGSRPVRVGNAAAGQLQLDVFGELMDALDQARLHGVDADENAWRVQEAMLNWLEGNWTEPDDGIWEVRGGREQFTHSKVMVWVAFDRAVKAVEVHGLDGDVAKWRRLRAEVHDDVCANALDDRGVFTRTYGGGYLDASTLVIPLVGFLPPDDPRVVATVEAVQRELTVDGFVLRYSPDDGADGVGGEEGAFLLCSFWLVECLAVMGRRDEATVLYERLLGLRNDVGLLAEEYDPVAGRQLGNFPQAFSHIAIASSAMTLCPDSVGPNEDRARRG
ncbi:MAG: glycoside hydrolase family 15 protein [Acidimicrobiales bacterium]